MEAGPDFEQAGDPAAQHRAATTRSGDPGEMITVAVKVTGSAVRVEVTDLRGPGVPELVPAGGDEEGGRGLQLVAGLATRWGWRLRGGRTVTWFELPYG